MFTECTHTFDSGINCKSPAAHGTSLRFHHTPHQRPKVRRSPESEPLELPNLDDKSGILVAVTQIVHAFAERRIKRAEADTLFYGLKLASRLMTELDQASASYPIEVDDTQSAPPMQKPAPSRVPPVPRLWEPGRSPQDSSFQEMLDSIAACVPGLDIPAFEEMNKQSIQS